MNYKLAIFDMDGTILNTLEDLKNSTNYALRAHQLPERSMDEVKSFVGNGIRKLIERAVPQGSSIEIIDKVYETFKIYYKEHSADLTRPYEGIPELLRKLKAAGILTAVVSNKADFAVQDLVRDYFDGLFDEAIGEQKGMRVKPYPDMVEELLRRVRVTKEEAVFIGDSDVDYETSRNCEMDVIMVAWGFREKEFILACGAPFVVDTPEEIYERIVG